MIDKNAANAIFKGSLKLEGHESLLVVTDTDKLGIAEELLRYALRITAEADITVMEPASVHGTEPPRDVAQQMKLYQVLLLITKSSLTHTSARREATLKGARIATMPGATEDMINRCLDLDYERLRDVSGKLAMMIRKARRVKLITAKGTDMDFTVGPTGIFGEEGGVYDRPGAYGNLPEGEVAFAPSDSNGRLVIDGTFPGLGLLSAPLVMEIREGMARSVTGPGADKVKERLDSIGPAAYKVAELGIGLNPKARMTGNVLEDEKVVGTAHVAVGNDLSFGGKNDVPIHLDGVVTAATVHIDDKLILSNGEPRGIKP